MPLIVETYFIPYYKISSLFFPDLHAKEFMAEPIPTDFFHFVDEDWKYSKKKYYSDILNGRNIVEAEKDDSPLFYIRDIEKNTEEIKYLFNEIYYIENDRIVYLNKQKRRLKYYEIDGKQILFEKISFEKTRDDGSADISSMAHLPYLQAQDGEVVVFPDEEDE